VSEEVVTVFRLVGRQEPKSFGVAADQSKWDLLIQPMMVLQGGSHGSRQEVAGKAHPH